MSLDLTLEEKRAQDLRALEEEREAQKQLGRAKLQLRDASPAYAPEPASSARPTFRIGEAREFPHVPEGLGRGESGDMSPAAFQEFKRELKDAASKPDAASRDAGVQRAAKVAAKDWADQHGKHDAKAEVLHAARAQAALAAREIGHQLGLDPVASSAIGYSLERALEREGFRTFVNHAIDGVGSFRPSSAATAAAVGTRHSMETHLNQSMTWLAEHGVTREALKDTLNKHAGKLQVLVEMAEHPAVFQRTAQILAHSPSAAEAVFKAATDTELRHAVGSLTLASGETLATAPGLRAAGSAAVVAGALLKGESNEEVGRHAFRAAMAIAGGAAGGIAGSGFLSVGLGIAGAELGGRLADKVLEVYDKHFNPERAQTHQATRLTSQDEVRNSEAVLSDRMRGAGKDLASRAEEMGREYSMGRNKS